MGLEVSRQSVDDATPYVTFFGAFRDGGYRPSVYESNKTAAVTDVLDTGLILAFLMLGFCFYIVLPGIRGKEVRVADGLIKFNSILTAKKFNHIYTEIL